VNRSAKSDTVTQQAILSRLQQVSVLKSTQSVEREVTDNSLINAVKLMTRQIPNLPNARSKGTHPLTRRLRSLEAAVPWSSGHDTLSNAVVSALPWFWR